MLGLVALLPLTTAVWATDDVENQAPAVVTVSVSSATVCAGAKTDLTASGCSGSVRWSTTQTGATITVTPLKTTTYTAFCDVPSTTPGSGTATGVTTTTATGTVQVYTPIVLTPTSLSTLCNGGKDGQVAINASGGTGALQYQFNGQPFQTTNTTFGNLTAGTYAVAVKDAIGCTAQATVEVKQPPALSVSVSPVPPKCLGGSDGALLATAFGGVGDYRYLLNLGTPQVSGTFINLKANTTYSLGVTDKNNCIFFQDVQIGSPVPFDIKFDMKPARCTGSADGIVTVSATGGAGTYQYQLGTGPLQTGTQFTGLAANTYEITVIDGNGCQGKKSVVVAQPTPLTLTAVAGAVNCFGPNSGSIKVTPAGGTGAVQYQLSTGKTPQTSNVFTGLAIGDYTVVGTDANGCTSLASVTVGKAEPLKAQAVSIAATCCVCPTGAVKFTTTGGIGTVRQYQIIGQPYQTNSQINGLRPNTYRLRVADEVGCTDSIVAVVTDGAAITLSTGTIKNVTCAGGQDGQATVQVAGGIKPFKFYWTTERRDTLKTFTATQTSLTEGTYTVSVVDSNQCSANTLFVPLRAQNPEPAKPFVTQTGSGTLSTDPMAGIQWYVRVGSDPGKPIPNATGPTLVPVQSGQYYVIVTTNGCSSPPSDVINVVLTAVDEPASLLAVRVVPNPIVDRLRIEVEQDERSIIVVQLLDASGRTVMSQQIPAFTGKKQAEWPLTGVATGRYLLKLNANARQSVIRVLVE
ncbi:hypothetical protein GCM10028819_36050 [Spirosoma humi]